MLVAVSALLPSGGASLAQDAQVFRTATDVVTVGVSVQRGSRPVTGLALEDFEVTDNGIRQPLSGISYELLPVDLTVLLDVSGSVTGRVLDQLRRSVREMRQSLQPHDRLRLVTFNMRVQRTVDLDAASDAIDAAFAGLVPGGTSAVLDALAVALVSANTPERRQLIVLFSDGRDSVSITTPAALLDAARATSATVSVVLATPARRPSDHVYTDLASETGGTVVSLLPTDTLGDTFRSAVERFRSSYVLTYVPSGVDRVGRHTIDVRVARTGVDVRARRGYVVR